jgi:hypothetical protein
MKSKKGQSGKGVPWIVVGIIALVVVFYFMNNQTPSQTTFPSGTTLVNGVYTATLLNTGDLSLPISTSGSARIQAINSGTVSIVSSSSQWVFDQTGKITLPSGGQIRTRWNNTEIRDINGVYISNNDSSLLTVDLTNGIQIVTSTTNTWTFSTNGTLSLPGRIQTNGAVPEHSYGAAGDKVGMLAFDSTYIYYCTADYVNNMTDIWLRTAHGAGTW